MIVIYTFTRLLVLLLCIFVSVAERERIDVILELAENIHDWSLSFIVLVKSFTLCIQIVADEIYPSMTMLMTFQTSFQDHSGVWKIKLKVVSERHYLVNITHCMIVSYNKHDLVHSTFSHEGLSLREMTPCQQDLFKSSTMMTSVELIRSYQIDDHNTFSRSRESPKIKWQAICFHVSANRLEFALRAVATLHESQQTSTCVNNGGWGGGG